MLGGMIGGLVGGMVIEMVCGIVGGMERWIIGGRGGMVCKWDGKWDGWCGGMDYFVGVGRGKLPSFRGKH